MNYGTMISPPFIWTCSPLGMLDFFTRMHQISCSIVKLRQSAGILLETVKSIEQSYIRFVHT